MKAYIECGACKKQYECDVNKSPDECARKHGLVILCMEFPDKYKEGIYLCKECFFKRFDFRRE